MTIPFPTHRPGARRQLQVEATVEGLRGGSTAPTSGEWSVHLDSFAAAGGGRSFRFERPVRIIEAYSLGEVIPALAAVEDEVADGLHACGFVAYEAGSAFDGAFASRIPTPDVPLLWFAIFRNRLERGADVNVDVDVAEREGRGAPFLEMPSPSVDQTEYEGRVARILEYIAAGDIYQANLTFRLLSESNGPDEALYRDLCRAQRAAYCALIRLDRISLVSASPELFFHLQGREIVMRPMKGTRPRGRWSEEDDAFAAALKESVKERAENLMIVDLLRNDLGRIAEFGSVNVPRLFQIERYPTVHQMTSTVAATLRPEVGLAEIFRALFPSGSVTGAPKLRASQIIADLEDSPRGPYTGAIGFVSPGEAVFSVAIRTVIMDRSTGRLELGVGSGITADSDPSDEFRECLGKGSFLGWLAPEFRLLESLRFEAGTGFPRLQAHLDRLLRSARYFDFPADEEEARSSLHRVTDALGSGVYKVRLLLDRSGRVEVGCEPISSDDRVLRLGLAEVPVNETDPFLYHKTTWRKVYEDRRAGRPECDDVVLWNRRGELTESTTANLVLEMEGELVTPPLESGLLPGILREELVSSGRVVPRVLTRTDLHAASRIHLVNSVRGWRDAVLVT